jgi:hypothetical protein
VVLFALRCAESEWLRVLAGVMRVLCVGSGKTGSRFECREDGWLRSQVEAQGLFLISFGESALSIGGAGAVNFV